MTVVVFNLFNLCRKFIYIYIYIYIHLNHGAMSKSSILQYKVPFKITTHLNDKYQFLFLDEGITPGKYLMLSLHVVYVSAPSEYFDAAPYIDEPGKFFG